MIIKTVNIDDVKIDPDNVRTHEPRNLDAIKGSLERFKQQKPIVVDKDNIVRAGNGTVVAAKALGWTEIEIVETGLTGPEAVAYAIADNRTADLAEWDDAALAETLAALMTDDTIDETVTGFSSKEIDDLIAAAGLDDEIEEDDIPEVPVDAVTNPGDIWKLGDHRLLCGDATDAADIARLMNGEKAHLTVTDPPYNIDYGNIKHPKFKQRAIRNDNMSRDEFGEFCDKFVDGIKSSCAGCVYCFGPPGPDGRIMFACLDTALHCSTTIIWNKNQFTLGRGKYQNKYEPCWFGWVENGSRFNGDRTLTNVWDFDRPKSSKEHPTMKPVALIAHAIGHASLSTDTVFDPFLGSGTTLIAAEQLGRKCYGLEISPAYCDVIVKRWENLTSKTAERVEHAEPREPQAVR